MNKSKKEKIIKYLNEALLINFSKSMGFNKDTNQAFAKANKKWGWDNQEQKKNLVAKIKDKINLQISDFFKVFIGVFFGLSVALVPPVQHAVRSLGDFFDNSIIEIPDKSNLSFKKVTIRTNTPALTLDRIIKACIGENLKFDVEPSRNLKIINIYGLEKFKHQTIKFEIKDFDQSFEGNLKVEINKEY